MLLKKQWPRKVWSIFARSPSGGDEPVRPGTPDQQPVHRFVYIILHNCSDSYRDGSLLYMYLENFVTYDQVEIYPGAHMNMVMGPNGSGKSSIVAAMAIGLGWHPGVLGRSKDVSEFIKYNTEKAVIETVLRLSAEKDEEEEEDASKQIDWMVFGMSGPPVTGYLTIRRDLWRRDPSRDRQHQQSEWRVDGRAVAFKHVQALISKLNIQCDNLCQFLPQDRVSEFAKMSPTELLRETEKAAAGPEVLAQHDRLITCQHGLKSERGSLESTERTRDSLEKQIATLREIHERHQAYEAHLETIRQCEQKRPWLVYNAARERYVAAKTEKETAQHKLDAALVHIEPLRERLAVLKQRLAQHERTRQATQAKLERRRQNVEQATNRFVALGDLAQERRAEFYTAQEQRAKKQAAIERKRTEIRHSETELNELANDLPEIRAQLAQNREQVIALHRQIDSLDQELHGFEQQSRTLQRDADQLAREKDEAEAELAGMDDVRKQRLDALRRKNANVANAAIWLQQHRSEYPLIHGPICLEIAATRPNMAAVVEGSLGLSHLNSFVAEDDAESERFLNQMQREHNWRLNMIVVERFAERRPQTLHPELREAGFEGFAADFIEASPVIKEALLENAHISTVPVASGRLRKSPDSLSRGALAGIKKMITADLKYEIKVNRYAQGECIIRSQELRQPDFLQGASNASVGAAKEAIRTRIASIAESQRACQERLRELLASKDPITARMGRLQAEKSAKDMEKAELEKKMRLQQVLFHRLEQYKGQLKDLVEALARLNLDEIKASLLEIFAERKTVALAANRALRQYREAFAEVIEDQLADSLATGELTKVRARIAEIESEQEGLKNIVLQAERVFVAAKQEAKAALEQASRIPMTEENRRLFTTLPETLHELDARIAMEQARAELLQGASGAGAHAREQLATLERERAELEATIASYSTSINTAQAEMAKLHAAWFKSVSTMVARINANFRRFFAKLDSLGEVQLVESGSDYDRWEIAILVRFRDDEQLQRLTAQRQSGGEKSVSTILYLLALQEVSKSPFRVVDEINQGMDASNERKVHSLIVDTATTAENRSQYFLITPKLLTDLAYHENMHVLCVYNGEGMPEPDTWSIHRRSSVQHSHPAIPAH